MDVADLPLVGLKTITPRLFRDERGSFFESYQTLSFSLLGIDVPFVQDNLSSSKKNTIRGLHYQSHPGQAKLITCLQGKIWDVALDIRLHSPTFGKWYAQELDDETHHQLFIPVGFAHGFCVLSDTALVHYKTSAVYDPSTECSIRWDDPDLKIEWPIQNPVLSKRDQSSPSFHEVFG